MNSEKQKDYQYKQLMRLAPKLVDADKKTIKKWIDAFFKLLKAR